MSDVEKNVQIISKIIEARITSDRKQSIVNMLQGDLGSLYFTAPASSREEYHLCEPGGLAEHSINVYKNLLQFDSTFKLNLNQESMAITALFHDIGKACSSNLKEPHYIPETEQWKLKKGMKYGFNNNSIYMPNHVRSIFVIQSAGIKLNADEFTAILLNDGQYLLENKPYALKECPLALYIHMADRIALEQEKKK